MTLIRNIIENLQYYDNIYIFKYLSHDLGDIQK